MIYRVEDARFTQGKGRYVDDMKLPGMLFGDFVRSPYAHARVKSINAEAAKAAPKAEAAAPAAARPVGRLKGNDTHRRFLFFEYLST